MSLKARIIKRGTKINRTTDRSLGKNEIVLGLIVVLLFILIFVIADSYFTGKYVNNYIVGGTGYSEYLGKNSTELAKLNFEQSQQIMLMYMNRQETFFKLISSLVTIFFVMVSYLAFKSFHEIRSSVNDLVAQKVSEMTDKIEVFHISRIDDRIKPLENNIDVKLKESDKMHSVFSDMLRELKSSLEASYKMGNNLELYGEQLVDIERKLENMIRIEKMLYLYMDRIDCDKLKKDGYEVYDYLVKDFMDYVDKNTIKKKNDFKATDETQKLNIDKFNQQ